MDDLDQDSSDFLLCTFVAYLRAIYLVHQNSHWESSGKSFYGNHLLFQRLYESAQESADQAAEKAIGVFDSKCMSPKVQHHLLSKILSKYENEDVFDNSINIELDFQTLAKKVYNKIEENGDMTLGLDDMIMATCNDREVGIYLIKQAMK